MAPPHALAHDSAHDLDHDPVWQACLNAPLAEDELSPEERAGLDEGMADIRAGRTVSHAEVQAKVDRAARAMARFGPAENAHITLGQVLHWLDTGEPSPGIAELLDAEQNAAE